MRRNGKWLYSNKCFKIQSSCINYLLFPSFENKTWYWLENDFILINALKFNQVASTTYYFQVLKTKLDTDWKKNEIKILAIQKMKNKKIKA